MKLCPSCGEENPERARFCLNCAAPLTELAPATEQRKTVTVLFCDVVGSTALGESIDPEALRALLARYFERMKGIVEHHGGTVEKFIGDAVMAVFGVPRLHEDDALRACRAAVTMRSSFCELGISGRIGIATGEVVTGTLERLATGDAVNLAARLEQQAQPGEVLLDGATLHLVRSAADVENLEPLALKGKAEPVPAYRLIALTAERQQRHLGVMVGRQREQRLLTDAWERVRSESSCHLFTILGPAGVGKSRLLAEFLRGVEGAAVLKGRCLPYGEGITYWPVVEVLKQLPQPEHRDAAATTIRGLLGEEALVSSSDEIAWAFRKRLEDLARTQPVVCVFDDLHWGEETFLDLVEHIADLARDSAILLICMSRPELVDRRPSWGGGKVNATAVLLEPLGPAETEVLINSLAPVKEPLRARIVAAAEGNPLFVEEMIAMARGLPDEEVAVPPTIQALLAARLDQLDQQERAVLQCGAIEGRVFHRGAVAALAFEEPRLDARLTALVRKELVRPSPPQLQGEDAYRFRHLLIRDAAYEALPKTTRAALHERFADWLEQHAAELIELDEIIGFHLEHAVRYRRELASAADSHAMSARGCMHLASAGRKALAHGDARAAVNLLRRALALSEADNSVKGELLLDLAAALEDVGDLAEGASRAAEAVALTRAQCDQALELRARCELASLRARMDPSFTAEAQIAEGKRALEGLSELGNDAALAAAWRLVAMGENMLAHWERMREALQCALAHTRGARDRVGERELLRELALCAYWGPTPVDEALQMCERMLNETGGSESLRAMLLACIAGLRGMILQFDEARVILGQAQSIREDLGGGLELAALAFFWGPLELVAGNFVAAEAVLRSSCDALEGMGERGWLSSLAAFLAQALYAQDRLEEAQDQAQRSRASATEDDQSAQAAWRAVQASILARRGQFIDAERLVRQAVTIADRTDQWNDQGDVRMSLLEVMRLAGETDQAIEAGAEAIERYERKGNLAMVAQARARLDELITVDVTTKPQRGPAEPHA